MTPPERPRVGAVIVHFEAPDDLRASIRSLQFGAQLPDRILVVDNSETVDARQHGELITEQLGVEYLPMARNVGFGAGCNAGVNLLDDCPHVLLLNQDAVIALNTLERLSFLLAGDDRLAAVNPRIEHPDGRLWFASGGFSSSLARLRVPGQGKSFDVSLAGQMNPAATEWVNGCAVLLRRAAWCDVGGFDERFFMYWEDVDLSLRLVERGWELGVDLSVRVVHDQGDGGATKLTPTVIEHSVRSRLLFVRLRLEAPDRWTAMAYTVVNVVGLIATSIRVHKLRSLPHLRAVFAGLKQRSTDGFV